MPPPKSPIRPEPRRVEPSEAERRQAAGGAGLAPSASRLGLAVPTVPAHSATCACVTGQRGEPAEPRCQRPTPQTEAVFQRGRAALAVSTGHETRASAGLPRYSPWLLAMTDLEVRPGSGCHVKCQTCVPPLPSPFPRPLTGHVVLGRVMTSAGSGRVGRGLAGRSVVSHGLL